MILSGRTIQARLKIITIAAVITALVTASCALIVPFPPKVDLEERLTAFPQTKLPLSAPAKVYWNLNQVPFVDAKTDEDAAFVIGLIHAHLRLGQMEVMRRIAAGRISEMGGPLAIDIDHSLRVLNLGRVASQVVASMPDDTRRWLESFVLGINYYQNSIEFLPHEFQVLGLEREVWTAEDVITIGRLASVDVNWIVWYRLLALRNEPGWAVLWSRLLDEGTASLPSFISENSDSLNSLTDIVLGMSRSGSNAVAISGDKSITGSGLIASDPHLGLTVPNLWLIAGYRSPSYHAVGMMIPGIPFIAFGRNRDIGWGGTNMRAANSDLFDVSVLNPESFVEREEKIKVRWWFDKNITVRETEFGPIISDAPAVPSISDDQIGLRWIGHQPSDELTSMLKVNRARNWNEFKDALEGFAVSPQNMVFADRHGHIGMIMATHIPQRKVAKPKDLVLQPHDLDHWSSILTSQDLPASYNPKSGYLVSANNLATETDMPIGYFFSSNDRVHRLSERLVELDRVSVRDLEELQRDVFMHSAVELRNAFLERIKTLSNTHKLDTLQFLNVLEDWDGYYHKTSAGPVAIELLTYYFVDNYYSESQKAAYAATGRQMTSLLHELNTASRTVIDAALHPALLSASAKFKEFSTWGDMHSISLSHPLRFIPIIGRYYRFGTFPVSGGSTTIMKTANRLTDQRHTASYGSNARHISDMSDLDSNYLVLLGGQDGWINSTTFLDQVTLWRTGGYVRVPMRMRTIQNDFPYLMELTP